MKILKKLTFIFSIIALTSCNSINIEGAWVESVQGMPDIKQGFILEEGGNAASINMATLKYEKWEQKDNLLFLSGTSVGNHQSISFTDTLIIERLAQDSLILRKGELILKYAKVNEDRVDESVASGMAAPVKKTLFVKGKLIMGHEVRSFRVEGDSAEYWIVDETGELEQKYDNETNGVKNGTPVYVELDVIDMGKSNEGFAADYDGVYQVMKIHKLIAK